MLLLLCLSLFLGCILIVYPILLFYLNGNDDMTLHILLGGFESIKLIASSESFH